MPEVLGQRLAESSVENGEYGDADGEEDEDEEDGDEEEEDEDEEDDEGKKLAQCDDVGGKSEVGNGGVGAICGVRERKLIDK